ncbi:hypothetical protein AKO1_000139 [Acrasis kona]|uniref:Uncharacterized protein n=1 Tax=Acrasis kona TaxID=1008807 RepID=A0AAW2ZGE4_9EUKA
MGIKRKKNPVDISGVSEYENGPTNISDSPPEQHRKKNRGEPYRQHPRESTTVTDEDYDTMIPTADDDFLDSQDDYYTNSDLFVSSHLNDKDSKERLKSDLVDDDFYNVFEDDFNDDDLD